MIENIRKRMLASGWTPDPQNPDCYKRTTPIPVRTVIVNGEKTVQTADLPMSITYIGEGEMWAPYEEDKKVKIYGFTFALAENTTDIWVENESDFDFWYNQYKFSKMDYATDKD